GVSGNVNHVFEYYGEGVASLRVEERFTICNMGAELGVTTSLFPSDAQTKAFLERLGRGSDFIALQHEHPSFDTTYTLDLSTVDVMIAKPYAPDNVVPIAELVGMPVDQVCIGSCTNASFHDLAKAAQMLRGKQVHPNVSLTLSCGSKAVMEQLAQAGYLQDFIVAGARILECACGPCIGMGQAPKAGGVSLRTFNRNFKGRSGTADALVYLASVESATLAAIAGCIQNPMGITHEDVEARVQPSSEPLLCYPSLEQKPIVYGANIKPLPKSSPLPNQLSTTLLALLPDNVSTDHIIPATAKVLPYRSNLEKLSTFAFSSIAPQLVSKAKQHHGGVVFAGSNYGQGSSREHAALVLVALGIRVVVAQSFARIHRANLINFGILPLVYEDETLRSQVSEDERIEFEFSNLEQEHQLLATTSRGERLKL
ncbi:MAG: aconitase family protein, partial [Phocaeicola sp.]